MTDKRHCDGPKCDKSAPLNEEGYGELGRLSADYYIVLERPMGMNLHFCTSECLRDWTKENVK